MRGVVYIVGRWVAPIKEMQALPPRTSTNRRTKKMRKLQNIIDGCKLAGFWFAAAGILLILGWLTMVGVTSLLNYFGTAI